MDVLVAGHLCADLIPSGVAERFPGPGELVGAGPLVISAGGSVGNTGAALSRLGLSVTLEAFVGDDELGDLIGGVLRAVAPGAYIALSRTALYGTSYSIVMDRPEGDRAFWHYAGANAAFDGPVTTGHPLVHIGYPTALPALLGIDGERLAEVLRRLRDAGSTTSLDLSSPTDSDLASLDWTTILKVVLPLVDIISPSLADLYALLPDMRGAGATAAASWLVSHGAAVAMVTDAANGASLVVGSPERLERAGDALAGTGATSGSFTAASVVTAVTRTTGAGDVATAGLLAAIADGDPMDRWVARAMQAAALHVSGKDISAVALR